MEINTVDEGLLARCGNGKAINRDNIETIIRDNADTEFGRKYGFSDIRSIDEYRARVPLSEYKDHEAFIKRMRAGEKNILTAYPVVSYCLSSGSMGQAKRLPVTTMTLEKHSECYEKYRNSTLNGKKGKRLMTNSFRTDLSKPIEQELLFTEIYYRTLYEKGLIDPDIHIGGKTVMFITHNEDTIYAKLWEALLTEDVLSFESVFLYEQLLLLNRLEENWRDIIAAIRSHTIPAEINLSPELREYLLSLDVSAERLDYVERECGKGFDGIVRRLWKNIVFLSGIGNKHYLTEAASMKRYAPDVPRHHFIYGSSECHIGCPVRLDGFDYVLIPELAFFEFIPDGDERNGTKLPHEVEVGKEYEPVFTNFSGLYRYRIGDIVRITGFIGESPVMEVLYRKGNVISIANEKYNNTQLENAVFGLRRSGINIEDYCFGASLETVPGRYAVVMQLASTEGVDVKQLTELTDKSLRECNIDYDDLRNLGQISYPNVMICDAEGYADFAVKSGLCHVSGHNKAKHIFKGDVKEKEWKLILEQHQQNATASKG